MSRRGYRYSKRIIDVAGAIFALGLLSPVVLLAAVAVKATSRGPVIYRHQRVGLHGQTFSVYKFRSMRTDRVLTPEEEAAFKLEYKLDNDPRITRVGRWLRRLSIDEIPQLVNVLSGSMSIVGPRPVTLDELSERYGSAADELVTVKPGLTGLWQVSGRSKLRYEERIGLDLQYVRECSLAGDLAILARTPLSVLLMRGAE